MAIVWKNFQDVHIPPYKSYQSSSANGITYNIDEDGRGVIFGMDVSIASATSFGIAHGICLKDTVTFKWQNVTLPLSETHFVNGNNYVVLTYKYVEQDVETYKWGLIDCISTAAYDPVWHLILAGAVISGGNIISVDNSLKETADIRTHNLMLGLQGGTTGQYYHLTLAEYSSLQTILASGINHNTQTSGKEGGDGTHFYHLGAADYSFLETLFSNGLSLDFVADGPHTYNRVAGVGLQGAHLISLSSIPATSGTITQYLGTDGNQLVWGPGGGGGGGGGGIQAPTRIDIDSSAVSNTYPLDPAMAGSVVVFWVEPENIGLNTGSLYRIVNATGKEVRTIIPGDTVWIVRASDDALAAHMTVSASNIVVVRDNYYADAPTVRFTYTASSAIVGNFLKTDGTNSPTTTISWGNNKLSNLIMTDSHGTSSEAANQNYVDYKVSTVSGGGEGTKHITATIGADDHWLIASFPEGSAYTYPTLVIGFNFDVTAQMPSQSGGLSYNLAYSSVSGRNIVNGSDIIQANITARGNGTFEGFISYIPSTWGFAMEFYRNGSNIDVYLVGAVAGSKFSYRGMLSNGALPDPVRQSPGALHRIGTTNALEVDVLPAYAATSSKHLLTRLAGDNRYITDTMHSNITGADTYKITNLIMTDAKGTTSEAANQNYVDAKLISWVAPYADVYNFTSTGTHTFTPPHGYQMVLVLLSPIVTSPSTAYGGDSIIMSRNNPSMIHYEGSYYYAHYYVDLYSTYITVQIASKVTDIRCNVMFF